MDFAHVSVLLNETIEALDIKPDGVYLDGTLGGGGHSFHIASKLSEHGHLYGVDQDESAITAATKISAITMVSFTKRILTISAYLSTLTA